ncbi:aminodeoxychorismate synthase component I [Roseibium algae]|uniref:Probable branched-chain-amino-acid aminotransferase n=1 Tax=Roseibium algae TaxID=3123038 RepID=A0ABU8TRC5_9HYPH
MQKSDQHFLQELSSPTLGLSLVGIIAFMTSSEIPVDSVLLLDCLNEKRAQYFSEPQEVLSCRDLSQVKATLEAVERAQRQGCYVAGFLAYELGFAFEEKLRSGWQNNGDLLAWFGVYDQSETFSLKETHRLLAQAAGEESASLGRLTFDWSEAEYDHAFQQAQRHLAQGYIYQVNLTMNARFSHSGSSEAAFLKLLNSQPVAHAAFLKLEDRAILSLSPELFLEQRGQMLRARPMKGTAPRGNKLLEDRQVARDLAKDPKQRAENTMIVDLMRNDLSRIAETGSVKVTSLCEVERYKSLHQMTSTVEARLKDGIGFAQIIANLFPCGSITGAPKLSAMMIAKRLEASPRGVYTGSIGYLHPSGDFKFNVAIRTLVLREDGAGEVGTGSAVVYDSGAVPEYDECRLKLKFMTGENAPFSLFETMAFLPGEGIQLFERHMRRLGASAAYFGRDCDDEAIRQELNLLTKGFSDPRRVRLELDETGSWTILDEAFNPVEPETVWNVALMSEAYPEPRVFLFHKTTNRAFYDETRARCAEQTGCQEVLFANESGYLTEGSFTNIFLRKDGRLLTPALHHGLLPGTLREGLLETALAEEADLTVADLYAAKEVFVGNSVRGLVRVRLIETPAGALRDSGSGSLPAHDV